MSDFYKYQDTVAGHYASEPVCENPKLPGAKIKNSLWGVAAIITGISSAAHAVNEYDFIVPSSNSVIAVEPLGRMTTKVDMAYSIPEQISFIRSYLSLNASEAARALKVQRPSLYAWISGSSIPSDSNQARINLLYNFAQKWRERVGKPIGAAKKIPVERITLIELLEEDQINIDELYEHFDQLTLNSQAVNIQEEKFSVRSLAKEHGFKERNKDDKRRAFEVASGKK